MVGLLDMEKKREGMRGRSEEGRLRRRESDRTTGARRKSMQREKKKEKEKQRQRGRGVCGQGESWQGLASSDRRRTGKENAAKKENVGRTVLNREPIATYAELPGLTAEEWARQTLERGMGQLAKQYRTLRRELPPNATVETCTASADKSRYLGKAELLHRRFAEPVSSRFV